MQATYSVTLNAGVDSISEQTTIEVDTPNPLNVSIPAAKACQLTTRTDNDTGVLTLASGHGITTSHLIDLYSSDGLTRIREDMAVTAADSTTITINAGTGSNLPSNLTNLAVCKQVNFLPTILPDTIEILGLQLVMPGVATVGRVVFIDDTTAVAGSGDGDISLVANKGLVYNIAGGTANPLEGDPVVAGKLSHGNTSLAGVLKIISLEDRTP